MTALLKCPCGGTPDVENVALGGFDGPWVIHCPDCYDGTPTSLAVCSAGSLEDAEEWWNLEITEELEELAKKAVGNVGT